MHRPIGIFLFPRVPALVEFGQITGKVLSTDVVISADNPALKQGEVALGGVAVGSRSGRIQVYNSPANWMIPEPSNWHFTSYEVSG